MTGTPESPPRRTDPLLLVEAALVLILFALFVYFFLVPAASAPYDPAWWTWLVLGALFFAVIALDAARRRRWRERARRAAVRDALGAAEPHDPPAQPR